MKIQLNCNIVFDSEIQTDFPSGWNRLIGNGVVSYWLAAYM